jgi:hypothetical protein
VSETTAVAIRSRLVSTVWTLPYELRQLIYRVAQPELCHNLRKLRSPDPTNDYPLKPYDQLRCIFVHIPKCAGLSVAEALFRGRNTHTTIRQYQLVFTRREFDEYFKFAFVRNPWDRLVSAYHYLREGGCHEVDRRWAQANLSDYSDFDDFVRRWVNEKNVMRWIHFVPQSYFIHDPGSSQPRIDFIGHYENLQGDFSYITKRLGVVAELKDVNRTRKRRRDYRDYYTEATRRIVADVYGADIECLGYEFDNSTVHV